MAERMEIEPISVASSRRGVAAQGWGRATTVGRVSAPVPWAEPGLVQPSASACSKAYKREDCVIVAISKGPAGINRVLCMLPLGEGSLHHPRFANPHRPGSGQQRKRKAARPNPCVRR